MSDRHHGCPGCPATDTRPLDVDRLAMAIMRADITAPPDGIDADRWWLYAGTVARAIAGEYSAPTAAPNPDPLTVYVEDQERPLIWTEPRDRPGITIPLLLAIVVVVAAVVVVAVWGGTR